jgi:alkylation response protein AidB-like acyl-CoA dehydrogenase
LIRETTERFIEANFPLSRVRELVDNSRLPDEDYWVKVAELGWFAFLAPDELGGGGISGKGVLDAVILAEERGRALQPGPFIDTNVTVAALALEGTQEQRSKVLPALVSGECSAAWAIADPRGDWSGGAGVECNTDAQGYRLTGSKGLVLEGHIAGWLLIVADAPEGPTQFLLASDTPGLSVEVLEALDLTRKLCEVHLDNVSVGLESLVGGPGSAAGSIRREIDLASVLVVAESVGAMDHLFDVTLQYTKDRTAFGRPIGSFQAVKHQLADTSLLLEMSKAAAVAAAHAVQERGDRASESASIAKVFVGEAAVELAHKCWQNFGGIAYTWDHELHLYLRRLTTDASLYGSPEWHRERICQLEGI